MEEDQKKRKNLGIVAMLGILIVGILIVGLVGLLSSTPDSNEADFDYSLEDYENSKEQEIKIYDKEFWKEVLTPEAERDIDIEELKSEIQPDFICNVS